MKQIKKLIFQAAIMILLVTVLFFAWQKLVKNEVFNQRGRLTTRAKNRDRKKKTYFY